MTAAVLAGGAPSARAQAPAFDKLRIIAPASAGGGWDQTARAMQQALQAAGVVRVVEVINSPGAGGAIGLAQFVSAGRGDGDSLLVGGRVMISAIHANSATVSLLETTPIARLTGEYQVIVVPARSESRTLEDLVEALRANPGAISWAGGSTGGTDQILVGLLARAVGVDPVRINYLPFPGGGEAAKALLANQASAGVSGYAEFAPYIRSGKLRALALSAESRVPGIETPTLNEQGIDVALVNWRGVFGPPGISDAQRDRLVAALEAMVRHPSWAEILRERHWTDLYLPGDAFAQFVQAEHQRSQAGEGPGSAARYRPSLARIVKRNTRLLLLTALVLCVMLLAVALFRRQTAVARRRERALSQDLETARQDAKRSSEEALHLLQGLGEEIDRQFDAWGLTSAEREVAHLMLKGLRHKEIAQVRNTSERTVRQQALAIYKKAGLEGRTDLAAFFLEDLLVPPGGPRQRGAA